MSGLDFDLIIMMLSAVAAFVSVLAVVLPLIQRKETAKKYRALIEQQRKSLFQQIKENPDSEYQKKKKSEDGVAATMAAMFKIEQMAGNIEDIRYFLLQAGLRSPKALLYYIGSRAVAPVLLAIFVASYSTMLGDRISDQITSIAVVAAAILGFFMPKILVKNLAQRRQEEIQIAFPDALDMMLICVQGGVGLEAAINKISGNVAEHSETLAEELGILSAELSMLNDRRSVFQSFAKRIGSSSARSFATAMIQAEQYGTSIATALRVMADDMREKRLAKAEQKAASLPPKLTVPMILFFLPTLFVVILGPAAIKAMANFQ